MFRTIRRMQWWLRTHQKKFLGFLAVFLMAIWLPGYAIQYVIADKGAGTVLGQKVTAMDFNDMAHRWRKWRSAFTTGHEVDIRRDFVWRQVLLVRQAEAAGIVVTDSEVEERLSRLQALGLEFTRYQLSDAQVRKTIREALLVEKLRGALGSAVKVTTDEAWQKYGRENEQVKIRYVAFRAADFLPQVTVTDADIESFYELHKDAFPDEAEGKLGYKEHEKVKVEYILAPYADLAKKVSVSDEDLREYYEKSKDVRYKVEEPKKDEPSPGAAKSGKADAKADAPAADGVKSAKSETNAVEAKAKSEGKAPEPAKPEAPKEPTYKPFDSVKAEIEEAVRREKAEAEAVRLLNKVDAQIGDELDKPQRTSFATLAKANGLTYAKTEFFTAAQAATILSGAYDFAEMAMARDKEDPSRIMDSSVGKFVFQVLDKQLAGAPPLAEVREKVERDLKEERALKRAVEVAQECRERMKATSFEDGLKWAHAHVTGKPDGLKTGETDFFKRPSVAAGRTSRQIPELGGNRPNVAAEAFKLLGNDIGVATEERGENACYVFQVSGRKEATEDGFKKEKDGYMARLLLQKRSLLLADWEDGLYKDGVKPDQDFKARF